MLIFLVVKKAKVHLLVECLSSSEQNQLLEQLARFKHEGTPELLLYQAILARVQSNGDPEGLLEIFPRVFPEEDFDHQRLRYVMTDLARTIERFLVKIRLEQQPLLRDRLLLEALGERKLENLFAKTFKQVQRRAESQPLRDANFLYNQFALQELAVHFERQYANRGGEDRIPQLLDQLQHHSLLLRLKYLCEALNRQQVLSSQADKGRLQEVLEELAGLQDLPAVILVYECILQTLRFPSEEGHYQDLRRHLRSSGGLFTRLELGQLYAFALNYCIRKLNKGESEYLRELFTLYAELMEQELLHEEGLLPVQHYKNTVTVGVRLKEYTWTQDFIHQFRKDLPPGERENAFTYNMAVLEYARGNYGMAKRLLQKVAFTDVFYNLDSKAILLKCYYELEENEPLLSLLDALRNYLSRNRKISPAQRALYKNLIPLLRRLLKVRDGEMEAGELLLQLNQAREVADLAWLKEKNAAFIPG